MGNSPIYVETVIATSMDALWEHTQNPALHQRWDLRFTAIAYLPRPDAAAPQRFRYATRIGFGLHIAGEGESTGTVEQGGARTSALRFWSDDPKALIRTGSGYWQYQPLPEGIQFLTWYDYEPRFGVAGTVVDRLLFRPLFGWATAWSFDRLRLWLERGLDPGLAFERSVVGSLARLTLGLLWIYQGLVPKLLFPASGERAIIASTGFAAGHEDLALLVAAGGEIILGMLTLVPRTSRWAGFVSLIGLPLLLGSAIVSAPAWLVTPFNAPTLVLAMIALAAMIVITTGEVPHAGHCRRRPALGSGRSG
jgi:hypothetical protein